MGIEKILSEKTRTKIENGELNKIEIDGENLRHVLTDNDLEEISKFLNNSLDNKVEEIHLPRNEITDVGLGHLSQLKTIKVLNLSGNVDITEEGLTQLANLTSLKELIIYDIENISSSFKLGGVNIFGLPIEQDENEYSNKLLYSYNNGNDGGASLLTVRDNYTANSPKAKFKINI